MLFSPSYSLHSFLGLGLMTHDFTWVERAKAIHCHASQIWLGPTREASWLGLYILSVHGDPTLGLYTLTHLECPFLAASPMLVGHIVDDFP